MARTWTNPRGFHIELWDDAAGNHPSKGDFFRCEPWIYPLVVTNIAMENDPFIDG